MMHLKLTIMILFMNISLIIFFPTMTLTDNKMFVYDDNGDYTLSPQFNNAINSIKSKDKGVIDSIVALIDVVALIFDFIILLVEMFFGASIILLVKLEGAIRLILGVPLIICYGFAIVGWLK